MKVLRRLAIWMLPFAMMFPGMAHAQSCTPNNNNLFQLVGNTLSSINALPANVYTVAINVSMSGVSNSGACHPVTITGGALMTGVVGSPNSCTIVAPATTCNYSGTLAVICSPSPCPGTPTLALYTPPSGTAPCDIYNNAGTPCVAAHSTVRALFSSYNGPLYRVQRASDNGTLDVGLVSAGGYGNVGPMDSFCSGTTCYMKKIYDQTSLHNDATDNVGLSGYGCSSYNPIPAQSVPIHISGNKEYGLNEQLCGGMSGFNLTGLATGSQAEGIYEVASGSQGVSGYCCVSYGNLENGFNNGGPGSLHAIEITFGCWYVPCPPGPGPWMAADFEWGWFWSSTGGATNASDFSANSLFVTGFTSTDGTTSFNLKHGDAQSGGLFTSWSGALPTTLCLNPSCGPGANTPSYNNYAPLNLAGALRIGVGGTGDSNATGYFFEGAITIGRPSDAVDDAIQANIVAAGYTSIP